MFFVMSFFSGWKIQSDVVTTEKTSKQIDWSKFTDVLNLMTAHSSREIHFTRRFVAIVTN